MGFAKGRRALRRWQSAKRKKVIMKRLIAEMQEFPYIHYPTSLSRMVGRRFHSPASCSCWMCGNPRKYYKEKSYQEQKVTLRADAEEE